MIATTKAIVGPEAYSDKWYAYRTYNPIRVEHPVVIGGSQAAAALGVDRYTSPLELFLRLRGELPEKETSAAMEFGKRVERIVLEWYAADEKAELAYDQPMYFSAEHPFMGVTPDSLRVDLSQIEGVEAKTSTNRMRDAEGEDDDKYGKPGTDEVPTYILMQCQQYCAVLGIEKVNVTVLFDARTRHTYWVRRNQDLVESLIAAEKEIAERVINNDPPEPTWEMSGTNKILQMLYGFHPEHRKELSTKAVRLWNQVEDLQAQKKQIEAEIEANKNRILAEMTGAEIGVIPGTGRGIKRIQVKESTYTVNRKAHERMQACKV